MWSALFKPGKNISVPLGKLLLFYPSRPEVILKIIIVFIITPRDRIVRWVGNAEEMDQPLTSIVAAAT